MKRIIFEDKEERLSTLRKAFGIEKYKRIRENTATVSKRIKEECKKHEGYIIDIDEKTTDRTKSKTKSILMV